MPTTPAEIEATVGPKSASTDAGSMTARDAEEIKLLRAMAAEDGALSGTNNQGGPKSIWSKLRPAQAKLPGGV